MDWKLLETNSENGVFTEQARQICLDAREFGMRRGVSFPLRDGSGGKGGISFGAGADISEDCYRRNVVHYFTTLRFYAEVFHAFADKRSLSRLRFELTPREEECLKWLCGGLQQKIIAHKMGISQAMVEKHVSNLKVKLNSATLPQIVAKATLLNLANL